MKDWDTPNAFLKRMSLVFPNNGVHKDNTLNSLSNHEVDAATIANGTSSGTFGIAVVSYCITKEDTMEIM